MLQANELVFVPLLNGKVLDVDMACWQGRLIVVDNTNSSLVVVHVQHLLRFRFLVAKVRQYHPDTEYHLCRKKNSKEFSFSTGGSNGRLELAFASNGSGTQIDIKTTSDQRHVLRSVAWVAST